MTVFFDLDGVLLDTEPLYSKYWRCAAAQLGLDMSYEESLTLRSQDAALTRAQFMKLYGADVYDAMRERRKALMEAHRATQPIQAKPGAADLLSDLAAAGIPYYIVTASTLTRVARYTADAGLALPPDRVISTKSVPRGKPYPDVYENACKIAGCAPSASVAIEDSPNGIRSAYAAGCRTIMAVDLTEPTDDDRAHCHAVAHGLAEVRDHLLSGTQRI